MFDHDRPPEELREFAVAVEEAGVNDLWVVEDLGWAGSVSTAALALAATTRIRVGIGIAPVPLRNPALLAMELGALARVYPGRLVAGLGHGVPEWMRKGRHQPARKLAMLEETVLAVRGLLRGETVTLHGQEVTIDGVTLVHPPAQVPPIVTGVVRPRSLELSGRVADGTILAEGTGRPAHGRSRAHRPGACSGAVEGPHDLIVFAFLRVDDDPVRAAESVRETVEGQAAWLGSSPGSSSAWSGRPRPSRNSSRPWPRPVPPPSCCGRSGRTRSGRSRRPWPRSAPAPKPPPDDPHILRPVVAGACGAKRWRVARDRCRRPNGTGRSPRGDRPVRCSPS